MHICRSKEWPVRRLAHGGADGAHNHRLKLKDMNALTRWDPFRELEDMQNRLTNVLGRRSQQEDGNNQSITAAQWTPLVDVVEDEKEYVIMAELPEIQKNEIKLSVENRMLVLAGERKFKKEENGKKYRRIERAYGSFVRTFTLPDDADPGNVNAQFKDGVLSVHIAKSESSRPKLIEVK